MVTAAIDFQEPKKLDVALDLMRRMPPQKVEENLVDLIELVPELTEELLSTIDQPLRSLVCQESKKEFLICDYNRDGDSYRSPYSNKYFPPLEEGIAPPEHLRKLEIAANDAFNVYREFIGLIGLGINIAQSSRYYEGGLSSVYFWDMDSNNFAAAVLIKKIADTTKMMKGSWDSIHVIEVEVKGKSASYKLTTSILLYMVTCNATIGTMNLGGSLTRQAEQEFPVHDISDHIINMGKMVEDMEIKMRTSLQEIYFGKTKDVVSELRSNVNLVEQKKQADIQREIMSKMQERSSK